MRALALASLAVVAFSLSACNSSPDAGTRDVTGSVKPTAGKAITKVVAVEPGTGAEVLAVDVDASGGFTLPLATGKRYRILFQDGGSVVGVLRFQDGNGGYTTLLPVAGAPNPAAAPQDAGEDAADDDVSLGDVEDADGDSQYEPSDDPLAQVDSDADGQSDAADADDDDDGTEDVEDADDDNDGVADAGEEGDDDGDGVADEVEDGSDGGGGEGGSDSGP